jgi:hypothetical protein
MSSSRRSTPLDEVCGSAVFHRTLKWSGDILYPE